MPKISSEVRKAFITNLYSETGFTLDKCEQMVFVLNNYEDDFLKFFGEVLMKVNNTFALQYDGENYNIMRRELGYVYEEEFETFNYKPLMRCLKETSFNYIVQGIIDFIFLADQTKQYSLPSIGLIEIEKGIDPDDLDTEEAYLKSIDTDIDDNDFSISKNLSKDEIDYLDDNEIDLDDEIDPNQY